MADPAAVPAQIANGDSIPVRDIPCLELADFMDTVASFVAEGLAGVGPFRREG